MAGGATQRPHRSELVPRVSMYPHMNPNRMINFLNNWKTSGAVYGATLGLVGLYFVDWKPVAQYIPFYGGKFKEEE